MEEISRKMAKGAAWMVTLTLISRAIGLVSIVILARLLVPEDFGLVAMATAVIAVVELLQAFSFDVALIQNQTATRDHYDTAWTLNLIFALACAACLLLLAGPAGAFFGDPRVTPALAWLALGTAVQGFENIGVVAFQKEMELHKDFWLRLARRVAVFAVTVTAAFALRSYWALVVGMVAGKLLGTVLTYLAHPYRPRFSLRSYASLLNVSKWLFVNNVIFALNARVADFIVGRLAGPGSLGIYNIALEISNLPTTELSAPINRAVFPGYARVAKNIAELRGQFLKVISIIAIVTIPAAAGLAAIAPTLVPALLGEKWLASIPLIQVLAIYGLLNSLQTNMGYVFVAIGRPRVLTMLAGLNVSILMALVIVLTLQFGIIGTAWAALVTILIMLPLVYGSLHLVLRARLPDLVRIFWRPAFAAVCMFIVVRFVENVTPVGLYSGAGAINLIQLIVVGVVIYTMMVTGLWVAAGRPEGAESLVLRMFATGIQNRLGKWPRR